MNRTRLALLAFTLAVVMSFAATASATPSVGTLEIMGGYAKSSTEFAPPPNETMGGSLTFGAGYFRPIAPKTSWGVEVAYDNLGSTEWNDGVDDWKVSANILRITPEFRVNFGAGVGPSFLAQGGFGYYNVSGNVENVTQAIEASDSEGKFGFNMGAGVGFPVGPKTKLNIMGNYHSVSTEGESTNYMNLRAGIGLSL